MTSDTRESTELETDCDVHEHDNRSGRCIPTLADYDTLQARLATAEARISGLSERLRERSLYLHVTSPTHTISRRVPWEACPYEPCESDREVTK